MKNKKVWILITFCVICVITFSALYNVKNSASDNTLTTNDITENDPFQSNDENVIVRAPGSSNYITTDVIFPNPEKMTLEYDGNPVEVEYQFTCQNPCKMGLMIYVNGILQPYTVISTKQETTMHTVDMGADDTKRFKFEFTPVCGTAGDKLVVIFANVYNAKVMELTGDVNAFGNNQKISQPLPWTLNINADVPKTDTTVSTDSKKQVFSSAEKEKFVKIDKDGNRQNLLDNICSIEIRKDEIPLLYDKVKVNKAVDNQFELYVYGNLTGKYRVSLYGDFQQLKINGYDYIEIEVKKNEYTIVPFTLRSDNLQNYKNFFAVSAPMEFQNELAKSASVYIAEE